MYSKDVHPKSDMCSEWDGCLQEWMLGLYETYTYTRML